MQCPECYSFQQVASSTQFRVKPKSVAALNLWAALGSTQEATEKSEKEPQGLKPPDENAAVMSELKLRPPKKRPLFPQPVKSRPDTKNNGDAFIDGATKAD